MNGRNLVEQSANRGKPLIALALFGAILVSGCGGKRIFVAKSAEEAFAYAMDSYKEEDYQEAESSFQRVIFNFPGAEIVEEAMYYLADSYFMDEDYLLASNEFKRVSSEFPDGRFALVSLYKMGLCHMNLSPSYDLDQKDTRQAIDSFNMLIDRFPTSAYADSARIRISELHDKLAHKEFENGYYYFRRGFYDSAIIYFETMKDNYDNTRWMAPSLYYLSKAYDELDLDDDALEARRDLLKRFPGSREAKKVLEEFPSLAEESRTSSK